MASPLKILLTDELIDDKTKVKIVRFEGQMDESNVDEHAQSIYTLLDEIPEGTFLIFDLEALTYMNSKAIGYMTDWHLKVSEKRGEIILSRARENILDILNVVGLTQIIKSFPTIDEAKLAILQVLESRVAE